MSRRGQCHDNAVAESFFQLLKRERLKKKIYGTKEEARNDIFDNIEMFYNSKPPHSSGAQIAPTEYVHQYEPRLVSVWFVRGDSSNIRVTSFYNRNNIKLLPGCQAAFIQVMVSSFAVKAERVFRRASVRM